MYRPTDSPLARQSSSCSSRSFQLLSQSSNISFVSMCSLFFGLNIFCSTFLYPSHPVLDFHLLRQWNVSLFYLVLCNLPLQLQNFLLQFFFIKCQCRDLRSLRFNYHSQFILYIVELSLNNFKSMSKPCI